MCLFYNVIKGDCFPSKQIKFIIISIVLLSVGNTKCRLVRCSGCIFFSFAANSNDWPENKTLASKAHSVLFSFKSPLFSN